MANYILQELPEEMSDGKKVLYPKMQLYTRHDYEAVIEHMKVYAGNFSDGTMRAVFDAFVSTLKSWLPLGHSLKIDGLGVFSLSLGFDMSTPPETSVGRHVCIKGINFKPDPQLLVEMNREASFDRVMQETKVPQKSKYSREERLAKAKEIMDANGYMTLTDYVLVTGLSRTGASVDLKQLVADPASGITTRGGGSHKIWVRRKE